VEKHLTAPICTGRNKKGDGQLYQKEFVKKELTQEL
jgi:hypothetical protein